MFGLIEVKNRDIDLVYFSDNKDDVVKEMKTRFAHSIIVCGFTVDDIKASQRFNELCDREIAEAEVDDAVLELIEIAEAGGFDLDGDYSNECNFAWYCGKEAQITTLDDERDWKIVDTKCLLPEELGDFGFILDYIKGCEEIFGTPAIQQLRALWTAFCIKRNIDVDTDKYDKLINEMWLHLLKSSGVRHTANKFEKFDNFMCEFLV